MAHYFVTGGAGFIGSNLVDRLVSEGHHLKVYDNLSLGKQEFIQNHIDAGMVQFFKEDLLNLETLTSAMKGCEAVFHLAANSDIGYGAKYTDWDLKQGTIVTYNVLEAMRLNAIKKIVFASTSAIYGEATVKPTPENYGPLWPISFYGASKLACEGLITSFAHNYGIQAWMYRFGNIVGRNGTHGALFDFILKLKADALYLCFRMR